MKRFCLSICLCLGLLAGWAQVAPRYDKGSVEVMNGRVLFQKEIATALDPDAAFERIEQWAKGRFGKPNVIVSKFVANDAANRNLSVTAEEYIVFTKKFFVLDRTRINYWVGIQCNKGGVTIQLTRINYWYEEERDGGSKFNAEETITDKHAFNKKGTKLLREQGKFRCKTIDFFEQCVMQLASVLS